MSTKYEQDVVSCPHCGSHEIAFDHIDGVYVCIRCGSVVGRAFYEGYEQRWFDTDLPRTSGSYTDTVHDHGIGGTDFDLSSGRVKVSDRTKWRNLRSVLVKSRTTKAERVVEKALRHLNMYAKKLDIPSYVKESAAKMLRKAVEGGNYKDKTLRNLAVAAIYVALKIHGLPKPAKLLCKEAGIELKDLWHAEKKIYEANNGFSAATKQHSPETYITLLVSKLGLSNGVEKLAIKLIGEYRKLNLDVGKPAVGIAAAAVYLASILMNEKKTQQQVAEALGISDVSIRSRYGEMVEFLDITVYI